MATHEVDLGAGVPERIVEVFEHYAGFYVPDEIAREIRDLYKRVLRGRCMLCNAKLADETHIVVNPLGIVEGYCSMRCHTDMIIQGWLSQQYQDMAQAIEFRGKARGGGNRT